jgi:arsenical pump membrane protein
MSEGRAGLNAAGAESLSVAALFVVLAWAVIRPGDWPEAVVAVPAAVLVTATGAIPAHGAAAEARRLGPVIGFLAAVLVLAQLCADEGLFRACGAWMARASAGRPRRLLAQVFAVAAVTTAVLSLDATVVLLTPVVFATAGRLDARAKPHVYACTHLANSASLLLPVSNLTNLLAFAASGLAFGRFAALMALPWLAAIGTEYVVFGRFFAADLDAGAQPAQAGAAGEAGVPVFTVVVVAVTLAGVCDHVRGRGEPRLGRVRGRRGPGGAGPGAAPHYPREAGARRRRAVPGVRARLGDRGRGGDRQRARRRAAPAAAGRDLAAGPARGGGTGRRAG